MSRIRVAVLFGGVSNEHEISLISAYNVIQNLPKDKFEIIPVGITKKGRWMFFPGDPTEIQMGTWENNPDCTPAAIFPDPCYHGIAKIEGGGFTIKRVDVVFPVLHGKNGEDGTVQGLLELAQLPYVGCGVLASACAMDKSIAHTILEQNGIRTARWKTVTYSDLKNLDKRCEEITAEFDFPMFVKPANGGSSVGINKANSFEELADAIQIAFSHDKKVVVEEMVAGRELECAVLGNDIPSASTIGEICSESGFYDYDSKYVLSNTTLSIPADIPAESAEKIRETALRAYAALGCSGLSRVDFFLGEDGTVILNEINTMPGFTPISMYPKLMNNVGVPYGELLERLIRLALERSDVIISE